MVPPAMPCPSPATGSGSGTQARSITLPSFALAATVTGPCASRWGVTSGTAT